MWKMVKGFTCPTCLPPLTCWGIMHGKTLAAGDMLLSFADRSRRSDEGGGVVVTRSVFAGGPLLLWMTPTLPAQNKMK